MNVHDTIKAALEHSPRVFSTGGEVLYHMFAVTGNRYEWIGGEIVYPYPRRPWNPENGKNEDWNIFYSKLPKNIKDAWDKAWEEDIKQLRENIANSSALAKNWEIDTSRERFNHAQSSYALIFHVPDDVKPDWAEAAAYVRGILEQQLGWKF